MLSIMSNKELVAEKGQKFTRTGVKKSEESLFVQH